MRTHHQTALAFLVLAACVSAFAEDTQPLSVDELRQILPGATVQVTYESGNSVRWTNEADGTLEATWRNGPESGDSHHHSMVGRGTWRVSDEGKFCARIEWPKNVTDWCRSVLKSDDGTYALASQSGAPSWKMVVSR
ncbi:DUF995 domain-containing protein [Paraburkholderia oxyphila]|uniref:DUF995 domain-containing protein n=1 Tax=Paraburkholderia oxyphila TaxID=614212 RepID=UPI0009FD8338